MDLIENFPRIAIAEEVRNEYIELLKRKEISRLYAKYFIVADRSRARDYINLSTEVDGKEINFTSLAAEGQKDYCLSVALKYGGTFPDSYPSDSLLKSYKEKIFEICVYEEVKRMGGRLGPRPDQFNCNNMDSIDYMEKLARICEYIEEIQNRNSVTLKPAKK